MTEYGVGIIHDEAIDKEVLRDRPFRQTGKFIVRGLGNDLVLQCGSGLQGRYYGCPYGTYILTIQEIGSIIARVGKRSGLNVNKYNHVWNVGIPGNETATGYDPGAGRGRGEIQIHTDSILHSEGCVVLVPKDFIKFYEVAMGTPKLLKLEVVPTNNPYHPQYIVSPRDIPPVISTNGNVHSNIVYTETDTESGDAFYDIGETVGD